MTVDDDGKQKTEKVSLMLWRDVPQYRTEFLNRCIQLFNQWHLFEKAPPNGNGWANERAVIVEILELLEMENNAYDSWLRDKEDDKRNSK